MVRRRPAPPPAAPAGRQALALLPDHPALVRPDRRRTRPRTAGSPSMSSGGSRRVNVPGAWAGLDDGPAAAGRWCSRPRWRGPAIHAPSRGACACPRRRRGSSRPRSIPCSRSSARPADGPAAAVVAAVAAEAAVVAQAGGPDEDEPEPFGRGPEAPAAGRRLRASSRRMRRNRSTRRRPTPRKRSGEAARRPSHATWASSPACLAHDARHQDAQAPAEHPVRARATRACCSCPSTSWPPPG